MFHLLNTDFIKPSHKESDTNSRVCVWRSEVSMGRSSKDKRDIYYRLAKEEGWRARQVSTELWICVQLLAAGVRSSVGSSEVRSRRPAGLRRRRRR